MAQTRYPRYPRTETARAPDRDPLPATVAEEDPGAAEHAQAAAVPEVPAVPEERVPVAQQAPPGTVQQASVDIAALGGLDPNRQGAEAPVDNPGPAANTPPPEGVPEPAPVIDRTTVIAQAKTFIVDAATVANWQMKPVDTNDVDQLLGQYFDEGTTSAEDLADMVATEKGLNPAWNTGGSTAMTITIPQSPGPQS
jgi:hypothetical protein